VPSFVFSIAARKAFDRSQEKLKVRDLHGRIAIDSERVKK